MKMNMHSVGIGVDIEIIERFRQPVDKKDSKLLHRLFTEAEINYCLSHAEPQAHLAARYAGKEAVVKALHGLKVKGIYYTDIEIINDEDGVPQVTLKKEGYSSIGIQVSLSHSTENAIAFAMATKK